MDLPYRPCVGIALFDEEGRVFVGERVGVKGNWQMPQGGIDKGEDAARAARREMHEETSVASALPLAHTEGWLRYDLPAPLIGKALKGRYRGQEQRWFAFRLVDEKEIDLATKHPEFRAYRFVDLDEAVRLIVDFKRPIYEAVRELFRPVAEGQRPEPGRTFAERDQVRAVWSEERQSS